MVIEKDCSTDANFTNLNIEATVIDGQNIISYDGTDLTVSGKIFIDTESTTPDQPADGKGYIYSKSNGKLYWRSFDLAETELTAAGGGGGITMNNGVDNRIVTASDATTVNGEANLTFDTALSVGDGNITVGALNCDSINVDDAQWT